MLVSISSSATPITTAYGVNPKLRDESFRISRWKPRSDFSFFSGNSSFRVKFRNFSEFPLEGLRKSSTFSSWLSEKKKRREVPTLCLAAKKESVVQTEERVRGKFITKRENGRILSEGRDEDEEHGRPICPGCGIFMQELDPDLPGYYQKRKVAEKELEHDEEDIEGELDEFELDDEVEEEEEEEEEESVNRISDILEENEGEDANSESEGEFDWESDEWEGMFENEDDDSELDGFAPAGVGYGNVTEEVLERSKKKKLSKAEKKRMVREEARKERDDVTVCARCHSLRNYGQVKNQKAENLIPDFDFERLISTRLIKPTSNAGATVVIMVVDCVDFDGSFPKRAAKSLFKVLQKAENDPKLSKKLPKLVLVATKVDLLPSQISPARLDKWVRQRAKAGGAPKLSGVYLVSSRKDLNVRNLLAYVKELAGPRGNVWVIGAQNAGKSTLINALSKREGTKVTKLTEASVPGTTLGILRIGGILSAKAKMYDTPGLLHPYLMSMRLDPEERKMIEIRKELQPRTYRVKASYPFFSIEVS